MSRRPSQAARSKSVRRGRPRPADEKYVLVLYVTGNTPLSMRAVQNLRTICDDYLEGCHKLEVVDLYSHPEQAAKANVIAAPTMVKSLPLPVQRFVGDMSDRKSILARLRIRESP